MVEYDQQNTIVVVTSSTPLPCRKDTLTPRTSNIGNRDRKMQFAERYFGDLSEHDGDSDASSVLTTWKLKSRPMAPADGADATYTSEVRWARSTATWPV